MKIIERNFTKKPLVLFHEDLKEDSVAFIDKIAKTIGVTYKLTDVNLNPRHSSYSEKQLKALRLVGGFVNIRKDNVEGKLAYQLTRFYTNFIRYNTLFIAKVLPGSWFGDEPLIPKEELEKVRLTYQKDWEAVKKYALDNNPV